MTLTQTVEIPASRWLTIYVPPEIPAGMATVTLTPKQAEGERLDDVPQKPKEPMAFRRLYGIHKDIPGASVDDFLARCREDKEYELALEERQFQERKRARCAKLHS